MLGGMPSAVVANVHLWPAARSLRVGDQLALSTRSSRSRVTALGQLLELSSNDNIPDDVPIELRKFFRWNPVFGVYRTTDLFFPVAA
jgi:hypothetical protein